MPTTTFKPVQEERAQSFDLFRLSRAKEVVDLAPNTLRDYNARGLKFYYCGKPIFVSKIELADFIRSGGPSRQYLKRVEKRKPAKPERIAA